MLFGSSASSEGVRLDLQPLKPEDIPNPTSPEFQTFLNDYFDLGTKLIESMGDWNHHSVKHDGTVQILNLTSSSTYNDIRKTLGVKEYWCGRQSHHTSESVRAIAQPSKSKRDSGSFNPRELVRSLSHKFTKHPDVPHSNGDGQAALNGSAVAEEEDEAVEPTEVERQAQVMSNRPDGLYERFRRGLLEYHSENEREYIEACRETEPLHIYQKHVAEVWRLTYNTPPPTNPRTFVVLLLSRELKSEPRGQRAFMNISIPFLHPDCPEKKGGEKSRVRGKYVSVERVRELESGDGVEWRMATSSDAGGNIPRFVTNGSLPNSIAEDVPSFLKWMVRRFPEGGEVETKPIAA
ncbi:hypothetical protein CI109_104730 [Kwoniella shandongensis]|uniref:DUF3074 domain-containing protein n=1 Tax=Kwoniella shandongensis TaxID=1734106 RepID=A0A5M6BRW4_9TREE|nr:uncharacterized protein CI109_006958 [Kwoniella shandongensis]KAA5524700.1 hypothetical protein CI109_006958 [Kwoniella shandongensis]